MNTAKKAEIEAIEYIRIAEVKRLTGLSTSTIYRMSVSGAFPKQVKLGAQAVAWVKSEVDQWAAGKASARAS
ncbi:AlpA family transcriptional regulator [Pseudomonas gingeri]|uniref:helix-turn-helix transcriptional regulator n=1 Tax=Pseudomonas gingeri TaxID=117681 RepID=UPI0015A0D5BC|nr:AlpA family transcriptional regulator [Pseudomonas gingeri]NVZ61219.1 AlpA family transcriptional regulator [Pseudomonas gingeri]NVZ73772.1 AlpA family transcriptional regulator [Pseudomonas gingeri]